MTTFLQDLRYGIRGLRKSPGFTFVAVATLALGIGANVAIFALVDRVLLRLLPVRNPRELVLLRSPGPSQGHVWDDADGATSFTVPMYRDLRDQNRVFAGLLGQYPFAASVSSQGRTERARAELVTGNYFDVLGVAPALGRILSPDDDLAPGAGPVTVLSYGYWTRRFGADPAVLNKMIVVNAQSLTVVGVARPGFSGVQPGREADLFVPLMMKAQMTPFWNGLDDPKDYWLQLVGRLKPGISRKEAEIRLRPTYRELLAALLPGIKGWSDDERRRFLAKPLLLDAGGHGRATLSSEAGTPLLSLMGMVGLVLLITCSNLAGLLAARGAARQREYGIRLAIGASGWQLLRQSLVECLLFALGGGALGILVAKGTLQALLRAFPPDGGLRQLAVAIDPRVLGFAAAISLLAGLVFGISPALRAARLDPAHTLRGSGHGSPSAGREVLRFRRGLVTGQIALTLVLLVASGLFLRSLVNLGRVDLGLKPDSVAGFSLEPVSNGYTAPRTAALARNLTVSLAALPGVNSVSAAEIATLAGSDEGSNVTVDGAPQVGEESDHVGRNEIGPDYFATLGIPLISGRELTWRDDASAPKVALINETMARHFFARRNPIGALLAFGGGKSVHPDILIVGVVRNSKGAEVNEKPIPFVYTPYLQDPKLGSLTFYLRARTDPARLGSAIRSEIERLDPELPVFDLKTLRGQIDESLVTQRLLVFLSAAFGGLAALLAALGIYGVLAFSVAQRRQEIGVRIALGADTASVRWMVLSEVGRFLIVGGLIGLPAAYVLARIVESLLFGVRAADPGVFAAGTLLMALVALAASLPPARRAAKVDPMVALRSE